MHDQTQGRPRYFDPAWIVPTNQVLDTDICVYGGTAGGVIAAVAAARCGKRVVLLNPARHLGGMTTGGLGWTDIGNKDAIGGLARRFYQRVGAHYGREEEWRFEPHVAAHVLCDMLIERDVDVHQPQFLDAVQMIGSRLTEARMLGGLRVRARQFIDATYEGDLLAAAGVSYTVGRESNGVYGETLNGIQVRDLHQFSHPVDPYVEPGNPDSGLLPGIEPQRGGDLGAGDHRIQAYCFRVCMTDDPSLRVPLARPADFDESLHELSARWLHGPKDAREEPLKPNGDPRKFDRLCAQHKTDTNNFGAVSSDFIGANYDWPEASYEQRERIFQKHVSYQQGLYWFWANSERVPDRYREVFARWGLAADEFADTGHWPHQLYVREARRMVSDYVITEHDCTGAAVCNDPVGMAAYTMDSHNCHRFVQDGRVLNEGDVQVPPGAPYPISGRAIVPRRGECENLAVPVCVSASHIAFGSVRMEPVFMVLGESAGTIAASAIDQACAVQKLSYALLCDRLQAAHQVLE